MHQHSRTPLAYFLVAVASAIAISPAAASADTKSCVTSHASGQREAKAGHLKLAAQLYTACGSDNTCPEQLRTECTELLEAVRRVVPSVILSVVDGKGADASNVKVFSGDELLVDGLDGRALELDPGKHHLRFVLASGEVLSTDVLIREGEKNRLVEVRAKEEPPAAQPLPAPAAPPPAAPPPQPVDSGPPTAAWVASGVAVVGLATFGTFALLGSSDKSKLDDCAPACADSERETRDGLKTKFLIADIGLGVGAASAVLAGILFLSSGSSNQEQAKAAPPRRFDVAAGPRGAEVVWRGQF